MKPILILRKKNIPNPNIYRGTNQFLTENKNKKY